MRVPSKYKPGTEAYERYQKGFQAGYKAGLRAELQRLSKKHKIDLFKFLDEEAR